MALTLNNLRSFKKKKRKRVGRGNSSGKGTYSGRGQKGQRSRSGGKSGLKRLGIKSNLRQIPKKRGFNSPHLAYQVINIEKIDELFKNNDIVSFKRLKKLKLISDPRKRLKVLGVGELKKKLEVRAHAFSKTAKEAIISAGGKAIVIDEEKENTRPNVNKKKK